LDFARSICFAPEEFPGAMFFVAGPRRKRSLRSRGALSPVHWTGSTLDTCREMWQHSLLHSKRA
jgi:hypothetical protein